MSDDEKRRKQELQEMVNNAVERWANKRYQEIGKWFVLVVCVAIVAGLAKMILKVDLPISP